MADKEYLATRLFTDRDSAEREYQATLARGYNPKDINVVMTEEGRKRHFGDAATTELGNKALEGAGVGGGIGAVTGGALAAIAVAATVAVPGLGLLVAGPIAAALAGAGAGAVVGGGIGALVGAGIPEERVKEYETGLKNGGILMGVKPRTPEDRAYFDEEWGDERTTATTRRGV
ncbi:MAG TPA: hypothetical protein VLS25_09195 [Dehalococcoidia bacterium]|nr:hypothetical protein [Dehalococcoidia bacterium]